jgi:hypothetical protein
MHASRTIFCFILFPHPLAPSFSSYVAAFILSTNSNPEKDPKNANWALWVGYETRPNVVFWPHQNGEKASSNKYIPDGQNVYYSESMLALHKQTFIILRNLIHDWEQDNRMPVQCSALFDLYSKERLSDIFSQPLWLWIRKTLAPIDKMLGGTGFGPGANAAAKKCMKTWKSQLGLAVQRGGQVLGFEACPSGAERSNVACRVRAAGLQGSSRSSKRKLGDGKQKSDTPDGSCSSSSSAIISSSCSSSVDEDDDDGGSYKMWQSKRRPQQGSASPEPSIPRTSSIFKPVSARLIGGRSGRYFADDRCVSVTMLPRCAVLCAPVCTLARVCEAHDLGVLQGTCRSG